MSPSAASQQFGTLFGGGAEQELERGRADVRAYRLFGQRTCGPLHDLRVAAFGEVVQQVEEGSRRITRGEVEVGGCRRIPEHSERCTAAACSQGGIDGLPGRIVAGVVGQPRKEDLLGPFARPFRGGMGQPRRRTVGLLHQLKNCRLRSGRRDQAADGGIGKLPVVGVFCKNGCILCRGAACKQRDEEGAVRRVRAGVDALCESLPHGIAGLSASLFRHVMDYAAQGVLHGGVAALPGGDKHPGEYPDAFRARCGQFVHQGLVVGCLLGGQLCQHVGHDRLDGALPAILCPRGKRQQTQEPEK